MKTLNELLVHDLNDLHDAEQQIIAALPKMIKAVSDEELKQALQDHLDLTHKHTDRLRRVFDILGEKLGTETCVGMQGLIDEGAKLLRKKTMDADVRDAGIIGAAQKVEHYEIAGYGTARTYARELGQDEVAELLQKTLDEEGDANRAMTRLAERRINLEATAE